jgi:hypothetical protein
MSYFVVSKRGKSKGPLPPQVVAPWEVSAETQSQSGRVIANLGGQLHIHLATTID